VQLSAASWILWSTYKERGQDEVPAAFPLPRSGFKLLRLILIGYLHEGGNDRKPAGPTDVGRAVGLDPTLVSRNNAPLAALGLLERAENRRWRLTEGGVEVARAFEWDTPEVGDALAAILRSNEFVQRIVTYVRAQGVVDQEQVVAQMARAAGVKRTSEYLTGARALLELMSVAGLLAPDGDSVRVPARASAETSQIGPTGPTGATGPSGARGYGRTYQDLYEGEGAAAVTLHLNLSPSDLKTDAATDELAARIKRLLDALRSG
jgi:hypothetical protein